MIGKDLLDLLACPYCQSEVNQQDDKIICVGCSRKYPIKDGIPVMLIDYAEESNNQ